MKNNIFTMPMYKATSDENQQALLKIIDKHIPTTKENTA